MIFVAIGLDKAIQLLKLTLPRVHNLLLLALGSLAQPAGTKQSFAFSLSVAFAERQLGRRDGRIVSIFIRPYNGISICSCLWGLYDFLIALGLTLDRS